MSKYPDPYIAYLVEFHATRDFFECHELLEEHWKEHPDDGLSAIWVGLIQLAVGLYHERRGNLRGAAKLFAGALERLSAEEPARVGLSKEELVRSLERRRSAAESGAAANGYRDMNLEIADPELAAACARLCAARGLEWGTPSDMGDAELIHRHSRRDRSGVVAARRAALLLKGRGNGFGRKG